MPRHSTRSKSLMPRLTLREITEIRQNLNVRRARREVLLLRRAMARIVRFRAALTPFLRQCLNNLKRRYMDAVAHYEQCCDSRANALEILARDPESAETVDDWSQPES